MVELRENDVPKHQQLAAILRDRIESGEILPHFPIPSKRQLMQEFGVAGNTIDKAVRALKSAGLVRTVTGMGIYVTDPENWLPSSF
jgi:GntR family transcriptional regulator